MLLTYGYKSDLVIERLFSVLRLTCEPSTGSESYNATALVGSVPQLETNPSGIIVLRVNVRIYETPD